MVSKYNLKMKDRMFWMAEKGLKEEDWTDRNSWRKTIL
jgi:hypothetical protein